MLGTALLATAAVVAIAKLAGVKNLKDSFSFIFDKIKKYSKVIGKGATEKALVFYYVMTDDKTKTADKVLIFAAIGYIVMPWSICPRAIFGMLGYLDEFVAAGAALKIVQHNVTEEIKMRASEKVRSWFESDVYTEFIEVEEIEAEPVQA